MTALNFPASPSSGDVHNAANGLQYAFDGVKWTSQGTYDSGTINAQKLDSIASQFNGSTTTFNLKVNNVTVKPHNAQSVSIVLAGHPQEPATAYTINSTAGTITFATAPANGTTFFGVLLSRLPVTDSASIADGSITNAKVASNAAIAGSKLQAASGSNAGTMSSSDFSKLAGIETSATADQTGAEIKSAYEGESDTNAFTDADHTKLDGIATGAEVNVNADWNSSSGDSQILNKPSIPAAYANSDVDSHLNTSTAGNGQILSWTGSDYDWVDDATGGGGGGLSNVVEDTTPQLGGDLDVQNRTILTNTTNGSVNLKANGSGVVIIQAPNTSYDATLQLNCSQNSHGVKIKSPPHSAGATYTLTLPTTDGSNGEFLKTDGSGVLSWGSSNTSVTSSNVNAAFGDTAQLILGSGASDAALKLYYGTGSGTSYGVITADNGVHIQFDGANRLETHASGTKWIGDLNCDDNQTLKLGSSADLKIYHDQNNSIIDGTGTGSLLLYASDIIFHEKSDASHRMADFAQDGSTGVRLYNDNSVKLATSASGVSVTGALAVTGNIVTSAGQITCGVHGTSGIQIINDGTFGTLHSVDLVLRTASTERARLDTNGNFVLNNANAAFKSISSSSGDYIRLYAGAGTGKWDIYGHGANLRFTDNDSAGSVVFDRNVDANGGLDVTGTVTVTDSIPVIKLVDSEENDDYAFINRNGLFVVRDDTNGVDRITLDSNGTVDVVGNLDVGAGIDVTGNITVTGTVDGVDIAALNTTVSGIASPTATTINALYPDNGNLILGTGTGDDTLKLYYDGTNAKITSNNAIHLQQDGANRLEISSSGTKWIGDLFCDDSQRLKLGSSADLQIYHDGTSNNSFITEGGSGSLVIKATNTYINAANDQAMIAAIAGGAVELYFDNSKKFDTRSSGVGISGNLFMTDSNVVYLGSSNDFQLYHDGSNSHIKNSTGTLTFRSDNYDFKDKDNSDVMMKLLHDGSVELYHDNSRKAFTYADGLHIDTGILRGDDNAKIVLGNSSDLQIYHDGNNSFIKDTGTGRFVICTNEFRVNNAADSAIMIYAEENGVVELKYDNAVKLKTQSTGVKWTGDLFCDDNQAIKLGSSADLRLYHDGTYNTFAGANFLVRNAAANETLIYAVENGASELWYDNSKKLATESSGVSISGTLRPDGNNSRDLGASDRRWATIYAVNALNTSDENEKKDINNCDLGLDFVNKINPVSYKWKDSQLGSKTHYGLLAQNIEDAVKSVGKTLNDFGAIHKPEQDAMALNYNQLIAPLVKAIQELSDKVAALEAA